MFSQSRRGRRAKPSTPELTQAAIARLVKRGKNCRFGPQNVFNSHGQADDHMGAGPTEKCIGKAKTVRQLISAEVAVIRRAAR